MQSIKDLYGADIAAAAAVCTVPAPFFAALVANESGGDTNAKRFEPGVLSTLWQVLLGRKEAYGSIKTSDLVLYVHSLAAVPVNPPASLPADAFNRLDALATSWGIMQILGYNAFPQRMTIEELKTPQGNLKCGTHMLTAFAYNNHLDVTTDFESMFRCWNGGHPTAQTFDPQYVPKGIARMALYTGLE